MRGHDKNKTNISKHIKKVADEKRTFYLMDLVYAFMGVHHTDDWQERLDSLVVRGWLYYKSAQNPQPLHPGDYSLYPIE